MNKRQHKQKLMINLIEVLEQIERNRRDAEHKRRNKWAITAPRFLKWVF